MVYTVEIHRDPENKEFNINPKKEKQNGLHSRNQ
jgi:hypothetical protein